jgi:hypothetical protein
VGREEFRMGGKTHSRKSVVVKEQIHQRVRDNRRTAIDEIAFRIKISHEMTRN